MFVFCCARLHYLFTNVIISLWRDGNHRNKSGVLVLSAPNAYAWWEAWGALVQAQRDPSTLYRASRYSFAEATPLPSPRCYAETSRNSGESGQRANQAARHAANPPPSKNALDKIPALSLTSVFAQATPRQVALVCRAGS